MLISMVVALIHSPTNRVKCPFVSASSPALTILCIPGDLRALDLDHQLTAPRCRGAPAKVATGEAALSPAEWAALSRAGLRRGCVRLQNGPCPQSPQKVSEPRSPLPGVPVRPEPQAAPRAYRNPPAGHKAALDVCGTRLRPGQAHRALKMMELRPLRPAMPDPCRASCERRNSNVKGPGDSEGSGAHASRQRLGAIAGLGPRAAARRSREPLHTCPAPWGTWATLSLAFSPSPQTRSQRRTFGTW